MDNVRLDEPPGGAQDSTGIFDAEPTAGEHRVGLGDRFCFEAGGPLESDSLYVFTRLRPESWVIPVEGAGGQHLLDELIRRGLLDARLAIEAMQADHGFFCWPPDKPDSAR